MYLTYILLAFLIGLLLGIGIAQFSGQINSTLRKWYKVWTFKHKAAHPYKSQEEE